MSYFKATQADIEAFNRDGYIIVENLLSEEEISLMLKIAKADLALANDAHAPKDAEGRVSRLSLRNELDEDMYSACVRSPRIAKTMEALLGDEVYHYHHKMMMKEPKVGGAWEWHQDYGYWYNNGCLYPDMASCMIAVDEATKANGCLQVIKGSHLLGRIEHGVSGTQTGADLERVDEILKHLDKVYVELKPGSAVFFHSNLLHASDANVSDKARWTLICCYNTKHNDPVKKHSHPNYSPLEIWSDEKILEYGKKNVADVEAAV